MKVVHVNNTDIKGGAAKAAHALHKALLSLGVDSSMLVQRKFGNDNDVYSVSDPFFNKHLTNLRLIADLIPIKIFTNENKGRFSFGSIGIDILSNPLIESADIIHFHWINEGFISLKGIEKLKMLNKSIVWTFHDMWGFTGGCHYSAGCKRYENECSNCPFLKYPSNNDFSRKIQTKKIYAYKDLNLTIITCSKWLGECVKESSLLHDRRVEVIPNTLDIETYKPFNKLEAREKLNISKDKTLISFGTMNTGEERKGFEQLKRSLIELINIHPELKEKTELLIFGSSNSDALNEIPVKANFLGRLNDSKTISLCYNAADVFVAPSLEDNLPNTVMESLACGTPVVAFNIGGMPDMIEHLNNGYLAEPYLVSDLAKGIFWCLGESSKSTRNISLNSYKRVLENYSPDIVAGKYLEVYKSLKVS